MRKFGLLILIAAASPVTAQDAPVVFEAARTAPLARGDWSYTATLSGSEARFGGSFLIRCDRSSRRVTLLRIQPVAAAPSAMIVTTDLATNAVPADGTVASSNRLLDAIAFSRGRFLVSGGGSDVQLVASASPEAARSIEDCRI